MTYWSKRKQNPTNMTYMIGKYVFNLDTMKGHRSGSAQKLNWFGKVNHILIGMEMKNPLRIELKYLVWKCDINFLEVSFGISLN